MKATRRHCTATIAAIALAFCWSAPAPAADGPQERIQGHGVYDSPANHGFSAAEARFDFMIRHNHQGAVIGNLQVRMQSIGFRFEATSLTMLRVDRRRNVAIAMGIGRLNGQDGFSFHLDVRDGPDMISLRLYRGADMRPVYDSGFIMLPASKGGHGSNGDILMGSPSDGAGQGEQAKARTRRR